MATALQVIAAARSEVGYTESPAGSNKTKFAAEAGHANGAFWCATFTTAVLKRTGTPIAKGAGTASTRDNLAAWKKAGRWVEPADIRAGDIPFFHTSDRNGKDHSIPSHTGIATGPPRNGRLPSIEGNTSSDNAGDQENGGGVYVKNRPLSVVIGAGRPAYDQEDEDMYSDADRARDQETFNRVKNLEAVANRDIDTLQPILLEVLERVKADPGSGGGAGDVDAEEFVAALRDVLVKGTA